MAGPDRMRRMRALVNPAADPARVPPPSTEARAFHEGMAGYRPTPVHDLPGVARDLEARIFLPGRSTPGRRDAIAGEGAEVVVVDGTYEDAVNAAAEAAARPDAIEIADIGESGPARWVIDGYHTLFAEAAGQAAH